MSGATDRVGGPASSSTPLILGLGNPILCDDRVGLEVACALHDRLPDGAAVLREAHVGGLELLHVVEGWSRLLIIDAVEPGRQPPGEVLEIPLRDLERRYTPITPHNAGFVHCLGLGRACGLTMPREVRVFAIGVSDPFTFCDRCTPQIQQAIPGIVEQIHARVFGPRGCWPVMNGPKARSWKS